MWLGKLAHSIDRVISPTSGVVNGVGVGVLAVMMFLSAVDVSLRRLINRPVLGAFELTEFMMIVVIFFAIAYTGRVKGGHTNVDVLILKLGQRGRAVTESFTSLLTLIMVSLIAWFSAVQGELTRQAGTQSAVLEIPLFPFYFVAAFGSALYGMVLLRDLFGSLAEVMRCRWKAWEWLLAVCVLVLLAATAPLWLHYFSMLTIGPLTVGLIGIVVLILVLFSGMPVAFTMVLVGFLGVSYLASGKAGLGALGTVPYSTVASYNYSVIPLFLLMGEFAFFSGLSQELYSTAYKWLGHLPGGLAMATIAGCAGFAAICGSSPATAATFGAVALPEMKRYNYDSGLATGSIAAGGTLGILIPPSIIFVIYGILTEQSIGKLLIAGIFPGLLLTGLFIGAIYALCRHNIKLGPPGPKVSFTERVVSLKGSWVVLALFLLIIGGIYQGFFTATEGAGIGATGVFLYALAGRKLSWKGFSTSLMGTGETAGMCLMIVAGAMVLNQFLALSRLPYELSNMVAGLPLPPIAFLLFVILIFLFLGCVMSSLAMIILCVPIFYPIIMALGYDPIWFGVIIVLMAEMGMITPPVGINVFIIAGMAKDVPMYTVFRGIIPFLFCMVVCVIILIAFPQIALFLPNLMK